MTQKEITEVIGVKIPTISRELKRNKGKVMKKPSLTTLERKTGYPLTELLEGKHSEPVTEAVIELLKDLGDKIQTIVADYNKKFAGHEDISKTLGKNFTLLILFHA